MNIGGVPVENPQLSPFAMVPIKEAVLLPKKSLSRKIRKWLFAIVSTPKMDLSATEHTVL